MMPAGDNVKPLLTCWVMLIRPLWPSGLKKTWFFDDLHDVAELAKAGNANAKSATQSWADGEWFICSVR